MFTIGDLFEVLEPGTTVTIGDKEGYLVILVPFESVKAQMPPEFVDRAISKIGVGYKSLKITLWNDEEE